MTSAPRNQDLSPVITLAGVWSGGAQDLPPVIQPGVVAAVCGHLVIRSENIAAREPSDVAMAFITPEEMGQLYFLCQGNTVSQFYLFIYHRPI